MPVIVLDSLVDAAGTAYTAHTPESGGPITAVSGAAAVFTDANRLRGQTQGTLTYAAIPSSSNYSLEATFYVASNANGIGISLSGLLFSYSLANGYWNLAGTGLPSGGHVDQTLTVGQSYKLKLAISGSTVTGFVDGVQIVQKTSSGTITPGAAGLFFLGTDTNSTGYQFENVAGYQDAATGKNEIQVKAKSGLTLYAPAVNPSGQYFTGNVFETRDDTHWAQYAIHLVEPVAGSGVYFGSLPTGLPAGMALLPVYSQSGGSPATTDGRLADCLGRDVTLVLDWSGTTVNSIAPLNDTAQIQLPAKANALAQAQSILDALYSARVSSASSGVISTGTDGQMTTWASPTQLDNQIAYWEARVALLSGRRKRVSSIQLGRV